MPSPLPQRSALVDIIGLALGSSELGDKPAQTYQLNTTGGNIAFGLTQQTIFENPAANKALISILNSDSEGVIAESTKATLTSILSKSNPTPKDQSTVRTLLEKNKDKVNELLTSPSGQATVDQADVVRLDQVAAEIERIGAVTGGYDGNPQTLGELGAWLNTINIGGENGKFQGHNTH